MWKSVKKWIEYKQFELIIPLIVLVVWVIANGCTPVTSSPVDGSMVNADALKVQYDHQLAKFELAAKDLERQYEQQAFITELLTQLATGAITNWGGVANLALAGGGIGLLLDNRRKDTVIKSMKRGTKIDT